MAAQRVTLGAERLPGFRPAWAAARWGVVTAWNPAGQAQDRAANRAAQARLRVAAARWSSLDGVNGDGDWQEPTLILTGISLRDVAALGGAFGQAAVLWGSGARAALVWLPASGVGGVRAERWWLRPAGKGAQGQLTSGQGEVAAEGGRGTNHPSQHVCGSC
ncbi:hypothetical protein Dcae01_01398 [Deinococcus caeni]|uniref:DUF3293 domain-containing protein n=1 Tax=Deinococcus caeni TaxID=569127 RepID=A0ABP9UGM0_9DEIO